MIEIIPAIMPDSIRDLEDKANAVANHVETAQLDIMDGKFVKSRSWPYFSSDRHSFENLLNESEGLPRWDVLDYEIDLMVSKPEEVVEDWIIAGASRIIVHIESTDKIPEIIKLVDKRVELGLALNLDTHTDVVTEFLEDIDFVQFMGIQTIGLQSQPFEERVLDKIRDFHNAHPEVMISIDGGVNFDTAEELVEAGAKRLVSGSAIFSGDVVANIEEFKEMFNG